MVRVRARVRVSNILVRIRDNLTNSQPQKYVKKFSVPTTVLAYKPFTPLRVFFLAADFLVPPQREPKALNQVWSHSEK